ncbi:MAG: ATP-binding cassette domain-containing protein [Bacteroidales bacterium]|nr:ATP-binding cassette domain-containing protein [Candidatus Liminaster caballi]
MIKYKGVTIEREQQLLLKDVDLEVSGGEFVYLIGKVGSGKSSLLKTIYAEISIIYGEARVFEYDLQSMRRSQIPYLRRKLGIVFQDFQLLTDRTVQQNLEFVLKATGWKEKMEIDQRIMEVLRLVGMENKGYRMPNTLSGGEQQRVVIARALLNNPSVILADEPTGNLDPETSRMIVQLLYDICHERGTTVIMSTHNMSLIDEFPGRVLKVEDGKVTAVIDQPAQEETSQEVPEETQSDSEPCSDDSNSDEDHCSPQDIQPEEQSHSEESDQKLSESVEQ